MRARKPILLYCADPELLSAMAFVLRLRDYDVAAVHEIQNAMDLTGGRDTTFRCAVLIHTQHADPAGRLIHLFLERAVHLPLLLVDRAGDLAPVRYADMVLYGPNTTMAHILSFLRLLCRQKRGPKPRSAA
ncbi:MAG: hypothetical protein ACYCOR_09435 [Acidobacteriaceae bacterium]